MSFKYFVTYIRTETCYFYFLLLQLFLIIALLIYMIKDFGVNHRQRITYILEAVVTLIVLLEIITRMIIQKKAYYQNSWNIVDLVGIIIIVALFILVGAIEASNPEGFREGNMVLPILLFIRYIAQLVRVLITLKQNTEMRKAAHEDINLEAEYKEIGDQIDATPLQTRLTINLDELEGNKYDSLS